MCRRTSWIKTYLGAGPSNNLAQAQLLLKNLFPSVSLSSRLSLFPKCVLNAEDLAEASAKTI